jgi:hypothetical protein
MVAEVFSGLGYQIKLHKFDNCNVSFCVVTAKDNPSLYEFLASHDEYFNPNLCWPNTVGTKEHQNLVKVCFHNGPHVDLPGHLISQPIAFSEWLKQFNGIINKPLTVEAVAKKDLAKLAMPGKETDVLYVEVADNHIPQGLSPFPPGLMEQIKRNHYKVLATNSLSVDPAQSNISAAQSNHYQLTESGIVIVERLPKVTNQLTMQTLTPINPLLDAVVLQVTSIDTPEKIAK